VNEPALLIRMCNGDRDHPSRPVWHTTDLKLGHADGCGQGCMQRVAPCNGNPRYFKLHVAHNLHSLRCLNMHIHQSCIAFCLQGAYRLRCRADATLVPNRSVLNSQYRRQLQACGNGFLGHMSALMGQLSALTGPCLPWCMQFVFALKERSAQRLLWLALVLWLQ
jgi:hypothetical protein